MATPERRLLYLVLTIVVATLVQERVIANESAWLAAWFWRIVSFYLGVCVGAQVFWWRDEWKQPEEEVENYPEG